MYMFLFFSCSERQEREKTPIRNFIDKTLTTNASEATAIEFMDIDKIYFKDSTAKAILIDVYFEFNDYLSENLVSEYTIVTFEESLKIQNIKKFDLKMKNYDGVNWVIIKKLSIPTVVNDNRIVSFHPKLQMGRDNVFTPWFINEPFNNTLFE